MELVWNWTQPSPAWPSSARPGLAQSSLAWPPGPMSWTWPGRVGTGRLAQPGLAELSQPRPGPIQPGLAARPSPGPSPGKPARPNPAWPGLTWPGLHGLAAWSSPAKPSPSWHGRPAWSRPAKLVGLGQVGLAPLGQGLRKDYTPHHTTRTTISRALKIRTRHVYENQWIAEGVRRNLKIDPGVCEINARFENHEGPDRTPPAPDLNVGMSSSQHGLNGIGRLFRTRSDPPQAESRNIEMRCARMLSRCASDPSGVYFANTGPEIRGVRCRLMC